MTATRRAPSATSAAPWSTSQRPERESTRASATSPGAPRARRSAARGRPPPAPTAGSRPRLPVAVRAARRASARRPASSDSTLQSSVGRPARAPPVPRGRRASPTSSPRRAPSARYGAASRRKASSSASNSGCARLAVEAEHAPGVARPRAQGDEQFLVAAVGLHVGLPARAAARVAAGRLVQRRDAPLGAGDVGQLVDVVLEVLVREPLRRQLRHLRLEVAGDQQRRRVEREPAGRHVVRHERWRRPRSTSRQNVTRSRPCPARSAILSCARCFAYPLMGGILRRGRGRRAIPHFWNGQRAPPVGLVASHVR